MSEHVFISYAQQHDAAFATKLHDNLEAEGFTVHLDRDEAKAAAQVQERTEEALQSCWVVVFVATKNSVNSSRCHEICNRALGLKKPVLPLLVEPVQLPSPFDRRQAIDFTGDFTGALARLRHHLTRLRSARGEIQTLRDRLSDLERELAAGTSTKPESVRAEIQELHELIYQSEQVAGLTSSPLSQAIPSNPSSRDVNNSVSALRREDWGEAPDARVFYGRKEELTKLEEWILSDRCQMVAVLGMGGIGKTLLTAKLAEGIHNEFEYVIWRSLQNALPLENVLKDCLQFSLGQQPTKDLPKDIDNQIALLIAFMREHRCLVVLDNVESVLQRSQPVGQYREGYEGYGHLFSLLGEAKHQSCLLLTSREKPKEVAQLEGKTSPVRTLQLFGLGELEGREILKDKGLSEPDVSWDRLIRFYSGNPLALKLASESIREVFGGDVSAFLQEGETIVGNIYDLLQQQFNRLSDLERGIMYWLAIEREPISLDDLREDVVRPVSRRELLSALESLRRRSMIESGGIVRFTLQPVIMEYVTDVFVRHVSEEIDKETIEVFASHAVIKAQAKDYVRSSQVRLILIPIAQGLITNLGKERSEQKLKSMLFTLQQTEPQRPGYAGGNILNLLIQLGGDLRSLNFSRLMVRQAYLPNVSLVEVNFADADLATSVFAETFGGIQSVAFSPVGEVLAAGSANGEVRLWHSASGTPLTICQGHTDWVRSVAFSPDGKLLASGSSDQTVRLWDVSSGQCLQTLQGHSNWVWSVTFSPDGKLLASGSEDQTVRLWDVSTGECLKILQEQTGWVWSVVFSPDGRTVASSSEDQTIRLWEISSGLCVRTLRGHTDRVGSVAFSPDGKLLASGSSDQTVRLWDVSSGQCLHIFHGHTNRVRSVAFSSVGNLIASGSNDQSVRLWDVSSGQCLRTLLGHSNWIWSVTFSPKGDTVASGSEDQTVRLWEISSGQCLRTLYGHTNRVGSVAFRTDGSFVISGGEDQAVRLWDVSSGQCLRSLQGHTNRVWSVAFSPDGKTVASGSSDQTVRLWDASSGQCNSILRGHTNRIWSVAFNPDGKVMASGSNDQTVRLWDVSSGQHLRTLQGHTGRVRSVAFSPDGRTVVSSGNDQTIRLWDLGSGQCFRILSGHTNRVRSVSFHPGGNVLASGSEDQSIRLWDLGSGQCLGILQEHTNRVWSVAFSPDGRTIASGGEDQSVRLWDVGTTQCIQTLQGHTGWVWSVAFSSDGKTVASGSEDGTTRLWDVQKGECVKILRSERPYEHMNITGVRGLTAGQKAMLKALGAFEAGRDSV